MFINRYRRYANKRIDGDANENRQLYGHFDYTRFQLSADSSPRANESVHLEHRRWRVRSPASVIICSTFVTHFATQSRSSRGHMEVASYGVQWERLVYVAKYSMRSDLVAQGIGGQ